MENELQNAQMFYTTALEFLTNYSFQILGALLIFIFGIIVSKYVYRFILRIMLRSNIDETISGFTAHLIRFFIVLMMAVLALGKLGISIAPFIAAVGALSLTAGLALQGSVSNFAAGIVLILTKPFKIGDTLKVHNVYGQVEEIKLAYTVLINEDKEKITIPNKYMIGDVLVNSHEYRLVDGVVGVSYDSDIDEAVNVITRVLSQEISCSCEDQPIVGIQSFAQSSVEIGYRYWVPTKQFFKLQYEVNAQILKAFKTQNISIAFPQREVRILQEDSKELNGQ